MSRHWAAAWKYHRPRDISGSPPQFAIDEIGNAAEKQADWAGGAGDIAQRQHRNAPHIAEREHRDHAACEAAMGRHAAVPQLKNFKRGRSEMRRHIEEYVTDSSTYAD